MTRMIIFAGLLASLIALPFNQVHAENTSQTSADAFVQRKSDVASYLAEITRTMERVRSGELGSMTEAELAALESAQQRIFRLLEGQKLTTDLDSEQRIIVYNAQELMQAIIRRRPYEQQICKAIVPVGTRISSYECMSWERRNERKLTAREDLDRAQRAALLTRRTTD